MFYFLGKLPFPVFFPILVCLMRWEHQNISLCFKKATFCAHFFGYTFWSPVFAITMRLCLANNFYAALKVASEASWDELDGGGEGEQSETTWSGFDTTLIFQFATPLQYLNPLASPSFQRTRNRLLRVGQTNMNRFSFTLPPPPSVRSETFCWFSSNPCHPTTLLVHLIDVFSLFWFTTIVLTLPLFYATWVQRSRTVEIQSKKLNWWGGWSEFRLKLSRNHLS